MRKSKLLLGFGLLVLSAGALTNCSYVNAKGHVVLSYNGVDYTAEELFEDQKSAASVEKQFDAVYKVAVRNYFAKHTDKAAEIKNKTDIKIAGEKSTAKSNADKNGTSYDTEWDKILDSNGVDDESELFDKFEYDYQKEEFEEDFYTENENGKLNVLKNGGKLDEKEADSEKLTGYLSEKQPYHVKQILVKVAGASDKDSTRAVITEEESIKLGKVIMALANGENFSSVAKMYSDDDGSKNNGGDLGIMDRDTSFVNDFKLGIYLYEAFYNNATKSTGGTYDSKVAKTELGLDSTEEGTAGFYATKIVKDLKDPTSGSAAGADAKVIGQIPYELAELFGNTVENGGIANLDFTKKGWKNIPNVSDQAAFYPRNVLFNKYFNKHNVMVITPTKRSGDSLDYVLGSSTDRQYKKIKNADSYKVKSDENSKYSDLEGFKQNAKNGESIDSYNNALRDTEGRLILVFRSGNGSGEGSYQGIHFVCIERSPFINKEYESVNYEEKKYDKEVSLDDYYTVYYPGQEGGKHPTHTDGSNKTTYVSYINSPEVSERQSRASTVKSKIKGYDSNLNTYIYRYLLTNGDIKFADNEIAKEISENITQWIDIKREHTKYESANSYNDTWKTWYQNLDVQSKKREQVNIGTAEYPDYISGIISEATVEAYTNWTVEDNEEDIQQAFGVGGVFHE